MYNKKYLFIFLSIIVIGLVCFNVYSFSTDIEREKKIKKEESANTFFGEETAEKLSPHDWIKEDQILVYDDMVVIKIKNAEWASFTDTNSMDPVLDYKTNAIQLVPQSAEEIHVGDIVSYRSGITNDIIVHRVVETGYDSKGWYMFAKGDNNDDKDPGKIRFSQLDRVVVAVVY